MSEALSLLSLMLLCDRACCLERVTNGASYSKGMQLTKQLQAKVEATTFCA